MKLFTVEDANRVQMQVYADWFDADYNTATFFVRHWFGKRAVFFIRSPYSIAADPTYGPGKHSGT